MVLGTLPAPAGLRPGKPDYRKTTVNASNVHRGDRIMLIAVLLVAGRAAWADIPQVAQGWGPDDWNISRITGYQYIKPDNDIISALGKSDNGSSTFSESGWEFKLASSQIPNSDFTVNLYQPWVVLSPAVKTPDGVVHPGSDTKYDVGGADLVLSYTGTQNIGSDIHFIQLYTYTLLESKNEDEDKATWVSVGLTLDKFSVSGVPWYPYEGRVGNDLFWMVDTPHACETPINSGLCSVHDFAPMQLAHNETFRTFIAVDNGALPNTNIQHSVTLYNGIQWGYEYTNSDTPEPAGWLLLTTVLLLISIAGFRHQRSARVTARRASEDSLGGARSCVSRG